jgi:hypothetical protein
MKKGRSESKKKFQAEKKWLAVGIGGIGWSSFPLTSFRRMLGIVGVTEAGGLSDPFVTSGAARADMEFSAAVGFMTSRWESLVWRVGAAIAGFDEGVYMAG